MRDQAHGLRNLIFRMAGKAEDFRESPPHLIVVVGAKKGVGTTTVAVNLAATLADQGRRVLLVDGHLHRNKVAPLAGMEHQKPLDVLDVLHGRCTVADALQTSSTGMMVLPGSRVVEPIAEISTRDFAQLHEQLMALQGQVELIVLDAGAGANLASSQFAPIADQLLIVTTCDAITVMDAYATIKLLCGKQHPSQLSLVTNQAPNVELAVDVYQRVAQSSLRFLALSVAHAGSVPSCDSVSDNLAQLTETGSPVEPAGLAFEQLASEVNQRADRAVPWVA